VIVGAPSYDYGHSDAGLASVYHGSPAGLTPTPHWTTASAQTDALYGSSVACAGDVNGDGYSDVIIGATGYDNGQTDEGRAFVYLGSATGLGILPAWTAEADQASARFGVSVATAGDVNGDGYSDVIIGADFYDNFGGRAFVYLGSAAGLAASPAWTVGGSAAQTEVLGRSVAKAGDVNGDGYDDVIVGAMGYDNGQAGEGRALVYLGSATGLSPSPSWMAEADRSGASFGWSVGTAGDINGDGYCDVIVGAPQYFGVLGLTGRVSVYLGSSSGLASASAWSFEGTVPGANVGSSVGTAGDIDGDGYGDVIVGARELTGGEAEEGRAYVFLGDSSGLETTPAWSAEGNQASAFFGTSLALAGDVDNGLTNEGAAFVFLGRARNLGDDRYSDWNVTGNTDAYFGWQCEPIGDVNGDGYGDVIVGEPGNFQQPFLMHVGRVFAYLGSATGLASTPAWSFQAAQASTALGLGAPGSRRRQRRRLR
jgi:hypothetical protein